MEKGQFYLFACPWDWTWVGQYVRHINGGQEIVIDNALYFTRTGATFDVLTRSGMILSGDKKSLYHPCGDGIIIPAYGPKIPWRAPTPWVKGGGR